MRFVKLIALPAVATIFITSCIRSEAPNAEADIISCEISPDSIVESVVVDNNSVLIRIKPDEDISALSPTFLITDGATISPASGSVQDFLNADSHTVYYTVTSEDGQWKKRYPVRISQNEIPSTYKFNSCRRDLENKQYYYDFYETDDNGESLMKWATGNPGYNLCGVAVRDAMSKYGNESYIPHIYEFFPTVPIFTDESQTTVDYIRLQTRSTGAFGSMMKMPIAAGNIFQGVFEMSLAVSNPRGATKFGETYRYEPIRLSGKYRYKAGATYTDGQGNVVSGKKDMFSIYALFFETDENTEYIDGSIHDANFKHPNLVSMAMLEDPHESSEWVSFDIEFKPVAGRTVDKEKLAKGKYKVGMVISSSVDGDYFKGAVGSTLDVKDLKYDNKQSTNE